MTGQEMPLIRAGDLTAGCRVDRAVTPTEPWDRRLVPVLDVRKSRDVRGVCYVVRLVPGVVEPCAFKLRPGDSVRGAPADVQPLLNKKQFEEYCNEHIPRSGNDGWSGGSGPRSRPWGTWVRSADRGYFDEMYRQYVEEGRLPD